MNEKFKSIMDAVFIVLLFVFVAYIVQNNVNEIDNYIGVGIFGILLYLLIVVISIVIAPVSMVPLIPLASNLWGWFFSAILNITGWTIGAMISFYLARKYGVPLVNRIISLEKINKLENLVPEKEIFWSIVFLRMSVPVDVLSYALGLFGKISFKRYFLATLIGITPFAFVFAYVGSVSFYYQMITLGVAIIILVVALSTIYRKNKPR